MYLRFCSRFGLVPVPATHSTIIRFLIHLSTYCKYCTIINYLSAINVLHRHFGHNVAFQDAFSIKLITHGLQRILGDAREQKLPITPEILLHLRPELSADKDSLGRYAHRIILVFSLKSNLVPKAAKDYDPSKTLSREDIIICSWGLVICVRWSKTIQFRQCQLLIPVVRLPPGHPLCPVQAYERHVCLFHAPPSSPAFLLSREDHVTPKMHSVFSKTLRHCLTHTGLKATQYSGHSFRGGGVTYAFRCGAPVELTSLQGD